MQKVLLVILLFVFFLSTSFYPTPKKKDLWQSWKEIQELSKQEKKPILIDIYADWCVYCHKMDATTYRDDSVYEYLKEHFYRFKFNGESKEVLEWNNKKFGYNKNYKLHDFYVYVANGNLVLPTTVVIMPDGQPYSTTGYMDASSIEKVLKYFATAYPATSFAEFEKSFKSNWK
jgi:thioredoxin-related protein